MSSSSISVGHDKSCVLELLLEVNLKLNQVTNVVLPLGMVDSELVTEIKDELAALCTILDTDADAVSLSTDDPYMICSTDGGPLASDDQSPRTRQLMILLFCR